MPTLDEGLRAIRDNRGLTNPETSAVAYNMSIAIEAIIEALLRQERQIDAMQRQLRR